MREIKFRAWDEENKIMYEIIGFIRHNNETRIWYYKKNGFEDNILLNQSFKNIKIMQYTGLKDKNGREIYEGDILQSIREYEGYKSIYYGSITVVLYNDYNARFEGSNSIGCSHKDLPDLLRHELIIIGNIYENQELLEKK